MKKLSARDMRRVATILTAEADVLRRSFVSAGEWYIYTAEKRLHDEMLRLARKLLEAAK